MVEGVFSFHKMQEACRADQPAGWLHFIRAYAPLTHKLLQHYFPALEQRALLRQVFRAARAEGGAVWRDFAGTSEKEFLSHLRRFVLEQGRAARGARPETPLTPENFWVLLQEFPPLQREVLLLAFHRYSPEEVSLFTKFETETVVAVTRQAHEKLRAQLGAAAGHLEPRDHDPLFAAVETPAGEKCVPVKTYARLVDGQVTWREREDAERHIENCLACLNRFAEFREVAHFFHTLPPADDALVAELAAAMGLPAQSVPKKKPAWWQRLLGG